MTFDEGLHYLNSFPRFSDVPGNTQVQQLLTGMGISLKDLKCVLVTGTNGKGSASALIASIAQAGGYKTGLFTSPHLHKHNERVKVNGVDISDDDFLFHLQEIKTFLDDHPSLDYTQFALLTVLAFLHFLHKKTQLVVLEVGMGGRLDCTNVVSALVSVITNVDLEHTEVLGDTKEKIAFEKAGILRSEGVLITAEQDGSVLNFFRKLTQEKKAQLLTLDLNDFHSVRQTREGQYFDFKNTESFHLPLLGFHQLLNAGCAILSAQALRQYGFILDDNVIRQGLHNVSWPLRLEIVHKNPFIMIDVGHNVHGVSTIRQVVDELFPDEKRILILGSSYDKPYMEMAEILSKLSDHIIVTQARYHGVSPEKIMAVLPAEKKLRSTSSVQEALSLALAESDKETLIMVFGGLYLGAEAKRFLDSYST